MILLVDIGNSRVKWSTSADGCFLERGVLDTAALAMWRPAWPKAPDCVVVSCVAGEAPLATLERLFAPVRMHVVRALAEGHGIRNEYERPEQLGADRFAAMVAAHRRDLGDCLVVSAGTAVTADMLTRDGSFLGGCIMPGAELMRASLTMGTAAVAVANAEAEIWPRTTKAAVATGIDLSVNGLMLALRKQLAETQRGPVTVVISGGARARLIRRLEPPWIEVDNLVLEGLAWIARDIGCAA